MRIFADLESFKNLLTVTKAVASAKSFRSLWQPTYPTMAGRRLLCWPLPKYHEELLQYCVFCITASVLLLSKRHGVELATNVTNMEKGKY